MEKLVESLGIARLSKSQVSEMAEELDTQVADVWQSPLDAGPYTFVCGGPPAGPAVKADRWVVQAVSNASRRPRDANGSL